MINFLGLSGHCADYRKSRYAVLPVPYDRTTSFQTGTRWGPQAVLSASTQVEEFDIEYRRDFTKAGVATLPPVEPTATGPEAMHEVVYRAARSVVRDGKFLIALGGEHSITSGLVRAVRARHRRLSVLQIDAHADLRDDYQGSRYSHASVMRRIWDMKVPVVGVGIRAYSGAEQKFMSTMGIEPISPRQTLEDPDWMLKALDRLTEQVYVTIDIDGFDPAYAPGTGTPEPGGLDWHQVVDLLKAVALSRRIVAADVVEVAPLPTSVQTEFLAARLIYKLMAHVEAVGAGR